MSDEPFVWIDLELIDGGTWSVRMDQVVSIADHRWTDSGAPFQSHNGAVVRLAAGTFGEVVQSRPEVLNRLARAFDVARGGVAWGFNDTC